MKTRFQLLVFKGSSRLWEQHLLPLPDKMLYTSISVTAIFWSVWRSPSTALTWPNSSTPVIAFEVHYRIITVRRISARSTDTLYVLSTLFPLCPSVCVWRGTEDLLYMQCLLRYVKWTVPHCLTAFNSITSSFTIPSFSGSTEEAHHIRFLKNCADCIKISPFVCLSTWNNSRINKPVFIILNVLRLTKNMWTLFIFGLDWTNLALIFHNITFMMYQ
jgi:hypothetical protein